MANRKSGLIRKGEDLTGIKVEDLKEEEEEMYVMGDHPCKEVEIPTDIGTDGASNGNTPERCPRPLYSQDHTEENHSVPQEGQGEDRTDYKVEDIKEEEETYVCGDQQCKEEEIPKYIITEILADGHNSRNNSWQHLLTAPDCKLEDKDMMSFTQKSGLVRHRKTHIGVKPCSYYECRKCYESFLIPNHRVHKDKTSYLCTECGACFPHQSKLARHMRNHTGEKPFPCSDCGKRFKQNADLIKHQRTHTGEKPFSCPDCGKCFTRKQTLVCHQRTHTGEKPYPCSECGKCFTRKPSLICHQRTHTGEKPFTCSECERGFRFQSCLIKHQRSHTVEKLFLCFQCGKCFTCKSSLSYHQRIHTVSKSFACSECGKCFRFQVSLNKHQRVHTGEMPFTCSDCGKRFRFQPNLITHQRSHRLEDKPTL
ncbi:oocyte zinc finger protein XlCOF6.1-like [Pseudophryne corroboree]|uniref:oocyte zinc finger protein XlCOF6.1-like n=1 Tax=Pseudophryne corroboree TaxID=495146 RepID=UPI003081F2C0